MPGTVAPEEGRAVLHLFFHLRRELLDDPVSDARDLVARVEGVDAEPGVQALTFSVVGQKADLGLMLVGDDLARLDRFHADLAGSPAGRALLPAASYVSLTERSEYTPDTAEAAEAERARLADEGVSAAEAERRAGELRERLERYVDARLHPELPSPDEMPVVAFYPMSKRRAPDANWYLLPFDERARLMRAHAEVGRRHRGRVLQIVTTSVGLDDWEWGVTLLASDPRAVRDVVHEMRFDEASARYADFGPFATGIAMPVRDLVRHLGLVPEA